MSPPLEAEAQRSRYSTVAIVLHWVIAAFIAANLIIGLFMESLTGDARGWWVRLHESFGFSVFVLALLRLGWRIGHRPPPSPRVYPLWERVLAHIAHVAFYVLMIGLPIAGWMLISSNMTRPMIIYWSLELPPFEPFRQLPAGPDKKAVHDNLVVIHATGAWIMITLLALHIAGALKHQFIDGEAQFARMGVGLQTTTARQTKVEGAPLED